MKIFTDKPSKRLTNKRLTNKFCSRALFTIVGGTVLINPVFAQQAQDQDQMFALIEIARAFGKYDAKRSFEILDPLIDQVNDLCTAARTLEGFGQENYDDEELNLENGNSVTQAAARVANALGTLALVNFERARGASDRLRLPEHRALGSHRR